MEKPQGQRPTLPRARGLPWGVGTKHHETLLPFPNYQGDTITWYTLGTWQSHTSRFAKTAYIGMEEIAGHRPCTSTNNPNATT
jgi:hypothetical protein